MAKKTIKKKTARRARPGAARRRNNDQATAIELRDWFKRGQAAKLKGKSSATLAWVRSRGKSKYSGRPAVLAELKEQFMRGYDSVKAPVKRRNAAKGKRVTVAVRKVRKAVKRAGKRVTVAVRKVRKAAKRSNGAARRRNSAQGAKALYQRFHGKASEKSIDVTTARHFHEHVAKLGNLISLKVQLPDDSAVELKPKGVMLVASEDGGQLYFAGGDQVVSLARLGLADQLPKDHVIIGPVFEITYETAKGFDGFKPTHYFHAFGEEGGEMPSLCYDVKSRLLYLVGGSYRVEAAGIIN